MTDSNSTVMNDRRMRLLMAFAVMITLISIRFYSFILIDDRIFDYIELLTLGIILFIYFLCLRIDYKKSIFGRYISAIIGLTLLSALPALVFHEQSLQLSFLASRTVIYWFMFFILYKFGADELRIENILVIFGFGWSMITTIQQVTFPIVYFNFPNIYYDFSSPDMDSIMYLAEERGGIIRMLVMGIPFGYFLIFYSWMKINEAFSLKHLLVFAVTAIALFLTGSRQIIFSLLIIFFFDFFSRFSFLSLRKIFYLLVVMGALVIIYPIVDDFFITLIEVTKEQKVVSRDYIRVQEMSFFLFDYVPHWICYVFGNGWEHSLSSYGRDLSGTIFFRSDVGLIGALNKFGALYVVIILLIFKKIIIPAQGFIVPHYIRLLFIFLAITSFTGANYFENTDNIMPFVFIFLILEKYNEKHRFTNADI